MIASVFTRIATFTAISFIICLYLIVPAACKNNTQNDSTNIATDSTSSEALFKKYNLDKISLPQGFSISVYAEVPNARSMCWSDKGTLYVGNRDKSNVFAVVDENHDGKADKVYTIASGLTMPCGVAYRQGSLYVAEVNRILRYDDIENNLATPPTPVVVFDKLPTERHHGWKFIAFGPDGKLYVPVGAPCNICKKDNPVYASITRMDPDGSHFEVFASGIRNSVGFDWDPQTGDLWFTDNGRDNLGDDQPNDELNHAPQKGMNFGFPYCHQGNILDPEFGKGKKCSDYTAPAQLMGPHVAAIGMRFYTGDMFPAAYKNQVFIAQHGSWNRSTPIGYRVMHARIEGDKVTGYEPFATGWLQDGKSIGRPADVSVAPDGALMISDDDKGAIYRVAYTK